MYYLHKMQSLNITKVFYKTVETDIPRLSGWHSYSCSPRHKTHVLWLSLMLCEIIFSVTSCSRLPKSMAKQSIQYSVYKQIINIGVIKVCYYTCTKSQILNKVYVCSMYVNTYKLTKNVLTHTKNHSGKCKFAASDSKEHLN